MSIQDQIAAQILGQNTSAQWSGQGFGSAQANALAMADILSRAGITDISQFGKVPVTKPVEATAWQLNGKPVYANPGSGSGYTTTSDRQNGYDEDGNPFYPSRNLSAQEIAQMQPTAFAYRAPDPDWPGHEVLMDAPASSIVNVNGVPSMATGDMTFGNKATGQTIDPGYNKASGDIWSGTYAGEGSTGYGAKFDAQGNPVFYTQSGGSSNDLSGGLGSLIGAGLSLAFPEAAPLIMGGSTLASGGSVGDAIKAGLLTYGGQQLMAGFGGSPTDVTVPTEAAPLPSSFDQYLAPTNSTSLTDIANTGAQTFPVADQTPFTGTSMLDVPTEAIDPNPYKTPDVSSTNSDIYGLDNPNYSTTGDPKIDMGGAQGLQPSTNANPNLDAMNGGQGITAPVSANLDAMGGAQGLTTAAAGGGILGQTGVNTGASLIGNLGSTLAGINTGVDQYSAIPTGSSIGNALSNLTPAQIAALGSGVLSGIGGLNTNSAIASGQAAQNAAAQQSLGTLKDIYGANMAAVAPYQQAGQAGVNQITQNMPYLTHQFDANDLNSQLAPNYQFMLGQGQMANQRAANVGGGALSGNTLQGLNKYTQDYAGNAYQNAFNNYNTQRTGIYNTLSNIAGLGQTANAQGIGAGNTYGTNVTNLNTGLAAAQAGANVAQGQNTSNTLSNIGNAATLAALLGQKSAVA